MFSPSTCAVDLIHPDSASGGGGAFAEVVDLAVLTQRDRARTWTELSRIREMESFDEGAEDDERQYWSASMPEDMEDLDSFGQDELYRAMLRDMQ